MSHWSTDQRSKRSGVMATATTVEAAVRSLDGREVNDLYIYPFEDRPEIWMAVGGGRANQYLVFISEANATFAQAIDPNAGPGETTLMIGGQLGNYPLSHLIGLDDAIVAATHFLAAKEPSPRLKWLQL